MTLEEVCDKYKVSPSTLKGQFRRVQERIEKKYGVRISKEGRGANTQYTERKLYPRAMSFFEEEKNKMLLFGKDDLKIENSVFLCFLGILIGEHMTFRGTYEEFLKYLQICISPIHMEQVKRDLEILVKKDLIRVYWDEDVFIAAIARHVEKEYNLNIEAVNTCRQIAEEHHKKTWIPLLKTLVAYQIAQENQPFTMADISEITGLSEGTIRANRRILEEEELLKVKVQRYQTRDNKVRTLGQNVDVNSGFHEEIDIKKDDKKEMAKMLKQLK